MKVFIASSGDLEQERKELKLMLYDEGCTPVLWETIDQSITENSFQDRINEEYLKTSDIVILIVKSRLGKYTMEEFEVAYKNLGTKIQKMYVYFLAVYMHKVDEKEQAKINSLKSFLRNEGKLYKDMENLDKLKIHFFEQKKYFSNEESSHEKRAIVKGMPKYTDENIYGRDEDLKELEKLFQQNSHIALINGFGGIGKTTLATKYYLNSQNLYEHMFWMEFSNSLEETFVNFYSTLFVEKSNSSEEEIVLKVLDEINNRAGNNLLVIDNVNSNKTDLIEQINNSCKVLITSRKSFDNIKTLKLKILSVEASKEIFKKHYKRACNEDTLDEIINKTGGHALTVELLAKAANKNRRKNLEDILAHMLEVNFDLSKVLNKNYPQSLVAEQLARRFEDDLKSLSESEKLILQNLSILTPREFNEKQFLTWMDVDEYDSYEHSINSLVDIGLITRVGNSSITMHQVISEVVKKVLLLQYSSCKALIGAISSEIAHDSSRSFIDYMEYKNDVENIINLAEFKELKEKNIAASYGSLATLYFSMGDFKKALEFQEKALNIQEEILSDKHPSLATSYNNISMIYQAMGELKKALEFQEKALNLREEILGDKHPNLATSYNNISMIYQDMGDLKKALEYQEKALNLTKEILGDKHPALATSYNNISMIYKAMGDLKKALEFQKKALNLIEEILDDKHPSLATSYNNISLIYQNMGELKKALEYQEKDLNLTKEILGDKHPALAISYANIAQIYLADLNIDSAKKYIDKSVNIFSELFPDGHPNLDTVLEVQQFIYSK